MTPKQLKDSSTKDLINSYKNKARCYHSKRKADAIYQEIYNRLGKEKTKGLSISVWHMEHGEGDAEFNKECDKLITNYE